MEKDAANGVAPGGAASALRADATGERAPSVAVAQGPSHEGEARRSSLAPRRAPPPSPDPGAHRFSTRRRLFVAFASLVAVFVTAFLSQVGGLRRIERELDQLKEHDEEARLTLELENTIQVQLTHQTRILAGDDGHLAEYRSARVQARRLVAELRRRIDEPEPSRWVADIADASVELDRVFEAQIAVARPKQDGGSNLTEEVSALAQRIDLNVDRIFRFLREDSERYHDEVKRLEESTLRLATLFLVGTPLFALALAIYLSRAIARPLALLGDGAAHIAAGDLTTRIHVGTSDEFGALAAKFNAMTAALKDKQEKLVRSEKLASLGRIAAGIAHELNNPLQVILGYISLDKHRVRGELASHLAAVEREANRCKEIVEDLLQLSRPAAPASAALVDLRDVSQEVASALEVALGERRPGIGVRGEGMALGTRGRLRQIIFNLVKNAAEAAGAEGRVLVEVSSSDGMVEVAVSDSGSGVAADVRERIFEPFFTTKPTGTGLGLSMARAIAGALGGDIEIDRSELGGARFALRLPSPSKGGV
jgi:two-component system, NtrC family, sensor kinase